MENVKNNGEIPIKNDNVYHPHHYTNGNIECFDAMISAFGKQQVSIFCKINAFKYLWRCDLKNNVEDVKKALWYIDKYIKLNAEFKKENIE